MCFAIRSDQSRCLLFRRCVMLVVGQKQGGLDMKLGNSLAVALGATLVAAAQVGAQEHPAMASLVPPTHVMTRAMHAGFGELVKEATGGKIDWEIFTGGSLLQANGVIEGLASGVAQGGHVIPAYYPSLMPYSALVGDMGALNPDTLVLAAAYADFALNDPNGHSDFEKNNLIDGVGTLSTPTYYFICKGELSTLADLQGKKVRTPGASYARLATAIGMIPVNVSGTEIYTAMERGVVDCVCADLTLLPTMQLSTLAESVVMIPLSPFFNPTQLALSPDYWRGLSDDERRIHLDAAARSMIRGYLMYNEEEERSKQDAADHDIALNEPDEALTKAVNDWVSDGFGGLETVAREQLRIDDPKPIMDTFAGYVDKWTELFADVDRTDEEAMLKILRENLHDRIDVATYGMQ